MRILKAIALIVGVVAIYGGLFLMALRFSGAGEGTAYFVQALMSPFSLLEGIEIAGFVVWPAVAALLALRRFTSCRIAAAVVLVLHYFGIALITFRAARIGEWYYIESVWRSGTAFVVVFLTAYITSQILMWFLISRRSSPNTSLQPTAT